MLRFKCSFIYTWIFYFPISDDPPVAFSPHFPHVGAVESGKLLIRRPLIPLQGGEISPPELRIPNSWGCGVTLLGLMHIVVKAPPVVLPIHV